MNPNESSIKGKFFQKKTLSEKNIPGGGKERIQSIQLLNLLKNGHPQNLTNFLEKEHPPTHILNEGVISLIKRYQTVDEKLYELLNILFSYGASPNISVIFDGEPPIKENENISLLMFAIKNKDLNLVNLILKFNPEINKADIYGRTPIIYAVIFNNNDSTDILNLLIQHKANINYSLQLRMSEDQYQYHSVFTLAIFQDLKNVTKCLLDNNVDVNFRTSPRGDTGLHIAAYYAKAELLDLLLSYPKIVAYIDAKNNEGEILDTQSLSFSTTSGPQDIEDVHGICIKCQACVKVCPLHAKYFDDPVMLSHTRMLEEHYARRAENEVFL